MRPTNEACWIPDEFLFVAAESLTSKGVCKEEPDAFLTGQIAQDFEKWKVLGVAGRRMECATTPVVASSVVSSSAVRTASRGVQRPSAGFCAVAVRAGARGAGTGPTSMMAMPTGRWFGFESDADYVGITQDSLRTAERQLAAS